jgi:hypothetical protein
MSVPNNVDGSMPFNFESDTVEAGLGGGGFTTGIAAADYDNDGFSDCSSPASIGTSCIEISGTADSRTSHREPVCPMILGSEAVVHFRRLVRLR